MRHFLFAVTAAATLISAPTAAFANDAVVQAMQVGPENVRYDKGVPTVDLAGQRGMVQIRPMPMDHGSYVFSIAVFNDGTQPANMDIGNIAIAAGSEQVGIQTVGGLIKKAKSRSWWSRFGVAMLGGLASGGKRKQLLFGDNLWAIWSLPRIIQRPEPSRRTPRGKNRRSD